MEQILHSQHARRKRNSPKVNLTISIALHGLVLGAAAFWAAREGYAGKSLQALTASIVPKEKKVEAKKPDPKAEEAKKEEVKKVMEEAKVVKAVAAAQVAVAPAPPPPVAVVAEAPPPVVLSEINFGDLLTTDPIVSYKTQVETALRAKWERPPDLEDHDFVAEVEVNLDSGGRILGHAWKQGSGNDRWDTSVKKALASTQTINRPPPKGFPGKFLVRFDVVSVQEVPVASLNR